MRIFRWFAATAALVTAGLCAAQPATPPPAALPPALLTDGEQRQLDDLLKSLNLTRKDTEFDKKAAPAAFRLRAVEDMLDYPLHVPDYSYDFARRVADARGDLNALLQQAAERWEIDTPESLSCPEAADLPAAALHDNSEAARGEWQALPAPLRRAASTLYLAIEAAQTSFTHGFTDVSDKEFRLLTANIQGVVDAGHIEKFYPAALWDSLQQESPTDMYRILNQIEWPELMAGMLRLTAASVKAQAEIQAWLNTKPDTGIDLLRLVTPYGAILIGGGGAQTYMEDAAILIDLGGDDTYLCRAGAGLGGGFGPAFGIAMDFGGSDLYLSRRNFSIGAGFLGAGIHIDTAGDDVYDTASFSQGCGIVGFGLHVDQAGTDLYQAAEVAQGAGAFGIGICRDDAGNDVFQANRSAQGFAMVRGLGILTTTGGNTTYIAGGEHVHAPLFTDRYQSLSQGFAIGDRYGEAGGGIAILHDGGGNDRYLGDIYAQGAGYWYSLGILFDTQGNDDYVSGQYAQGSGIHLAIGSLIDMAGNDTYTLSLGLGQGGTHDFSVGTLIDREGNDKYTGGSTLQGAAINNAIAIFVDAKGDDIYASVGERDQGGANPSRGFGSIGLFLDTSGKDLYPRKDRNNTFWNNGEFGAGMDMEAYPQEPPK